MKKIMFIAVALILTIANANEIEGTSVSASKKVSYRIGYFTPLWRMADRTECDQWILEKVLHVDHLPSDFLSHSQEERDWWRDKTEILVEFSTKDILKDGHRTGDYETGFERIYIDANNNQLLVQPQLRQTESHNGIQGVSMNQTTWNNIGASSVYKKGEIVGYADYENGNPKHNYQMATDNNGKIFLVRIDYIYQ